MEWLLQMGESVAILSEGDLNMRQSFYSVVIYKLMSLNFKPEWNAVLHNYILEKYYCINGLKKTSIASA